MTVGHQKLSEALAGVIDLLAHCRMSDKAVWFLERLQKISGDISKEDFVEVANEVRAVIAGIGSFSDQSLQPTLESGLSEMEAQQMQWQLADELDAATSEILGK